MAIARKTFLEAASWTAAFPPKAPNILFYFPEQLPYDFAEPGNNIPARTPNLKRLAYEGIRSTNWHV